MCIDIAAQTDNSISSFCLPGETADASTRRARLQLESERPGKGSVQFLMNSSTLSTSGLQSAVLSLKNQSLEEGLSAQASRIGFYRDSTAL